MLRTTIGSLAVNHGLPEDMRQEGRVLDKKGVEKLLREVAERYPNRYREIVQHLSRVGYQAAYATGGNSFGPEHMRVSVAGKRAQQEIRQEVQRIYADRGLAPQEKEKKVVELLMQRGDKLTDDVYRESLSEHNPLAFQVLSGSRGNATNLRSLRAGDLLYVDQHNKPIPIPILRSYSQGLTPAEYYAGTFGARKGVVDTKMSTQRAGFLCLAGGTLVRMADGTSRPIEDVAAGEQVLGADISGRTFATEVTCRFDNGVRTCATFRLDGGAVSVTATPDHKVVSGGRQVPLAGVAGQGVLCVTLEGRVRHASPHSHEPAGDLPTYDLEVSHPDHLFVLANGVVVSNSKQFNQIAHRLVVSGLDYDGDGSPPDEAPRGLPVKVKDADNEGALLARDLGPYRKNTVLTPKILADLEARGYERMLVRSPMVGGHPNGGLYARDLGVRERGGLPPTGDNVGIAAAQALCLAAGTEVRMADGTVKKIENVEPDDFVVGCDSRGQMRPVKVLARFDNGMRPCVKAVFRRGTGEVAAAARLELVATAEHKLLSEIVVRSGRSHNKYFDPVAVRPLGTEVGRHDAFCARLGASYDDRGTTDEPWALLLGLLVGDGCYTGGVTNGIGFSCYDTALLADVQYYLAENQLALVPFSTDGEFRLKDLTSDHMKSDEGGLLYRNRVMHWLRELGVWGQYSGQKVLPSEVFRWNNRSVAAVLAGLLATDGYVTREGFVGFSSNSYELLLQLKTLLQLRLGVQSSSISNSKKRKPDGESYDPNYRFVVASGRDVKALATLLDVPGVKKERLRSAAAAHSGKNDPKRCRLVERVPVGNLPTYDVYVSHPDHLFVLANGLVVSNSEPISQSQLCLARWTRVRMADGSDRSIEEVRPGEYVLGFSAADGEALPVLVLRVHDNGPRECCCYEFTWPPGGEDYAQVVCTPEHRFLARGVARYERVPVAELCEPDDCRYPVMVLDGRKLGCLVAAVSESQALPTFDLEVDHPDHLFVLANGLIVSNSSKHSGGVAGASRGVSGFSALNQLVQVPSVFKGGAAHAQADGKVTAIRPAPQGGTYVTVGNKQHYVAHGFEPKVKVGDEVEAGDVLSEGMPNPQEIVRHKGVGEGKRHFVDAYVRACKDSGIAAHRRNVEILARGLIDHVELDEEAGDHVPGDVISYSALEHRWKPREGHQVVDVRRAAGQYLERPVLHYSVGTKVRPSVARTLDDFGVKNVAVHKDPPPFKPVMIRGMENLAHDEDWMTRFLGSYLQKNFLRGVHRGDSSDEAGTSYVPSLARSQGFGRSGGPVRSWQPADTRLPEPPRPTPSIMQQSQDSSGSKHAATSEVVGRSAALSHEKTSTYGGSVMSKLSNVSRQPRVRVMLPHGEEGQFLLEELSNPRYPENLGRIRFPGGGVEAGETPEQAAVRELREELGLDAAEDKLERMGVLSHPRWGHDEHYFRLRDHGLKPGVYKPTVAGVGDPSVLLSARKPEGNKYFGPDVSGLLMSKQAEDDLFKSYKEEYPAGTHRVLVDDDEDSDYPLREITYPVSYGSLPGFRGEDGMDLDLLHGHKGGNLSGSFVVRRPEAFRTETKFYRNLHLPERDRVLRAFAPVLASHREYESPEHLLEALEKFRAK